MPTSVAGDRASFGSVAGELTAKLSRLNSMGVTGAAWRVRRGPLRSAQPDHGSRRDDGAFPRAGPIGCRHVDLALQDVNFGRALLVDFHAKLGAAVDDRGLLGLDREADRRGRGQRHQFAALQVTAIRG